MLKNRWLSLDGTVWNIPQGKATKPRGGKVWRCQRRVTTGRGPCGWGVCAPVVCGCVGGWVGGRAQHGWSKVKLEDTSDEAHPLMVAMGILLDSTVLWMSLHLSSHLDEPCCCQASWDRCCCRTIVFVDRVDICENIFQTERVGELAEVYL